MPVKISVDAMGGDHGLPVTVAAALQVLQENAELSVELVGDERSIRTALGQNRDLYSERLIIVHADEVVGMDELPSKALRSKKNSSMRVAINRVHEGHAQAAVSAGNTGALMAISRFVLKTLPGIDRPAIFAALPAVRGDVHMLDLGANVDCTPEHLFQFAVMGSALITALHGKTDPTVALLNVGSEEIKGNDVVRATAKLLQDSQLNYSGYVEGDGIFMSGVDLIVCDGFAGNVALKTGEGMARMIKEFLREEFSANLLHKVAAVAAMPALKALGNRINPSGHNGATFLGLNGTVVKSHGGADVEGFANAIRVGVREAEKDVPRRISARLAEALSAADADSSSSPTVAA